MTKTRVLACGSRDWTDQSLIYDTLALVAMHYGHDVEIIEGGARGADTIAREAAKSLGLDVITVWANWGRYGSPAGPIRNRRMLDLGPRLVVGFHDDIKNSRGTRDCVEEAERREILTRVVSHARGLNLPLER